MEAGGRLKVNVGDVSISAMIGADNVHGIAQSTLVCSGGRMNALAGGTAFGAEVEAGGLIADYSGDTVTDVSASGRVWCTTGAVLAGENAFSGATVSGGTSSTRIVLASGAAISACGVADMAQLHLDARDASIVFKGTRNRLCSVQLDGKASVDFGMSGTAPG